MNVLKPFSLVTKEEWNVLDSSITSYKILMLSKLLELIWSEVNLLLTRAFFFLHKPSCNNWLRRSTLCCVPIQKQPVRVILGNSCSRDYKLWLYVPIMSRTRFRVNSHSIFLLNVAPVLSKAFLDIQATIKCAFNLKRVHDMMGTYSQRERSTLT